MNAEQKRMALETLRQLSLTAYEIEHKAGLLHRALEAMHQKIEDAD
jgi:hypothetical protein